MSTSNKSSSRTNIILIVGLFVLIVVVASVYMAITAGNFVSSKLDHVTQSLANRSGVSIFLVKGIGLIVTFPFFWALAQSAKNYFGLLGLLGPAFDPLKIYRDKYGWIVIGYTGLFWIVMWGASRDAFAYKFCAVTPEGIVTADSPGKDPVYGVLFKPCTPEQAKILRARGGHLQAAQEITIPKGRRVLWFDGATGEALIYYSLRSDGYHFFNGPGNDPETGSPVQPVTQPVVNEFHSRQRNLDAQQTSARKQAFAEEKRRQQTADDESAAARAQQLFAGQDYPGALQACKPVLVHNMSNDTCLQVKRDASTELAHKLVDEGQTQLQHAQYDSALRDANEAVKLDPDNQPARRLQVTARLMKQKFSLN